MYGAGIIEDTQEKTIDGNIHNYYVMNIPIGNLKIMVSAGNAENLGLRQVYAKDEVIKIINSTTEVRPMNVPENWNQRYKENLEKIKTGKLIEVLEVYRNLSLREKDRGLSSAEKKMLTTVKQIIVSEIILSQNVDKFEAEEMLAESFQNCYN
jgi:CarD family transcriptional regulator